MVRLIALCPNCHLVKHYGLAEINGMDRQAFQHLKAVNHWTTAQTRRYLNRCFLVWERRSELKWKVDTSYLKTVQA